MTKQIAASMEAIGADILAEVIIGGGTWTSGGCRRCSVSGDSVRRRIGWRVLGIKAISHIRPGRRIELGCGQNHETRHWHGVGKRRRRDPYRALGDLANAVERQHAA